MIKHYKLSKLDKLLLKTKNITILPSRFGIKEKIFFFKELHSLLKGGIPILQAIDYLRKNNEKQIIKNIANNIYINLKKGDTLSKSFSKLGNYFTEADTAIIKIGEETGNLTNTLKDLSEHYKFIYETRKKYIGSLLYPTVVIIIAIIAIIIIVKYVLPAITNITSNMGIQNPFILQALLDTINFFKNYYIYGLIIGIIIFLILLNVYYTEKGQIYLHKLIFKLPIIGKITKYYYITLYLKYLKLLIKSGLDRISSFKLLKQILKNKQYHLLLDEQIKAIKKGESPFEIMKFYTQIIPYDIYTILKLGEESANIIQASQDGFDIYYNEFNYKIENLNKIIEPILIIIIGFIVLWIALSIFSLLGTIIDNINN